MNVTRSTELVGATRVAAELTSENERSAFSDEEPASVVGPRIFGREDRIVSDTALLPRVCPGEGVVSGLGPGLTC